VKEVVGNGHNSRLESKGDVLCQNGQGGDIAAAAAESQVPDTVVTLVVMEVNWLGNQVDYLMMEGRQTVEKG
jgi:hypothetical protein